MSESLKLALIISLTVVFTVSCVVGCTIRRNEIFADAVLQGAKSDKLRCIGNDFIACDEKILELRND